MSPCGLSNGLLLRKSPYTRSITVAALTDLTAVDSFAAPSVRARVSGTRRKRRAGR